MKTKIEIPKSKKNAAVKTIQKSRLSFLLISHAAGLMKTKGPLPLGALGLTFSNCSTSSPRGRGFPGVARPSRGLGIATQRPPQSAIDRSQRIAQRASQGGRTEFAA